MDSNKLVRHHEAPGARSSATPLPFVPLASDIYEFIVFNYYVTFLYIVILLLEYMLLFKVFIYLTDNFSTALC